MFLCKLTFLKGKDNEKQYFKTNQQNDSISQKWQKDIL